MYSKANPAVEPMVSPGSTNSTTATKTVPARSLSTSNYDLEPVPMGSSINAYTLIGGQRTNLYVEPALNAISLVRRGGPSDPPGQSGSRGNKLHYDYSADGGQTWDISKGLLYTDDTYLSLVGGQANYGARYPQGLIWNPAQNTNPANAYQTAFGSILTGTNGGGWGGLSYGSNRISGGAASVIGLINEATPLRQTSNALAVNGQGKIFHAEAEVDLGAQAYTGRIILTSFDVNPTTGALTPNVSFITLPDDGSGRDLSIADVVLAFSPDGNIGYLSMLANLADKSLTPDSVYYPMYYKTTDGGNTWVGPKVYSLTWAANCKGLRNAIAGDSLLETAQGPARKVAFSTTFEHDAVVDKYGSLHILTGVAYAGLINADNLDFRPRLSISTADVHVVDIFNINGTDSMQYAVVGIPNSFRGNIWAAETDVSSDNRYQTARNADGSKLFFAYFDTDTAKYASVVGNVNNKNILPDLFVAGLDVGTAGEIKYMKNRNVTDGSNVEGAMYLANVAPFTLESANDFTVAVSYAQISAASTDPIDHVFLKGVKVPKSDTVFAYEVWTYDTLVIINNKPLVQNPAADIRVYPNPAADYVAFAGNTALIRNAYYKIVNALGQTVASGTIPADGAEPRISTAYLKPGIYTVQIAAGKENITRKLIKK